MYMDDVMVMSPSMGIQSIPISVMRVHRMHTPGPPADSWWNFIVESLYSGAALALFFQSWFVIDGAQHTPEGKRSLLVSLDIFLTFADALSFE